MVLLYLVCIRQKPIVVVIHWMIRTKIGPIISVIRMNVTNLKIKFILYGKSCMRLRRRDKSKKQLQTILTTTCVWEWLFMFLKNAKIRNMDPKKLVFKKTDLWRSPLPKGILGDPHLDHMIGFNVFGYFRFIFYNRTDSGRTHRWNTLTESGEHQL
jgi:hypothetical protein